MYNFAILDPRNNPVAIKTNEEIFARGEIYGIEVTVPAMASRCVFNLDPQHTGQDKNRSAIEEARDMDPAYLPDRGATLVTVRADLDSIGAMAVMNLFRWDMTDIGPDFWKRIDSVARADKFVSGGYTGPKTLPTRDNPWDESLASAESSRPLAAIAAAVADFRIPLADRVAMMAKWLLTGEEPAQYRVQVEKERLDMIVALETGLIKHETRFDGKIAVVESVHRAATGVGYSLVPVVVALNPSFKLGGGEPHRKFTICAYSAQYADIKSALVELNELESGWGGSPTIGGSPQGVSSTLTVEQVVEVVSRHLK